VSAGTRADIRSSGRLLASVIGWKDEAYLEDLREKTRRGLAGQVRRGFSAGGRTYGYHTEQVVDSSKLDTHGNPYVNGYRRVAAEDEATVIRRIFAEYANGKSPKAIARELNRDRIAPPRGTRTKGWTWTALVGNTHLGTGILNNSLYIGRHVWNRFRWEKDPETGKRAPRLRPQDDWVMVERPELRIVPPETWEHVKTRQ
jgi:DNA invertase Pin-like site-specific DNA recombinase